MTRAPLTRIAHEALAQHLRDGDLAVDATVGNGHDTLFLAQQVGPSGRVIGFDVQGAALEAARRRLDDAGLLPGVTLYQLGHEQLAETLPAAWHGRVAAMTFNLGYLPGGDKGLITRAATTLPALRQALALLGQGGLLSLLVYRGHRGADDEAGAVAEWVSDLDVNYRVAVYDSPGPLLYLIERQG